MFPDPIPTWRYKGISSPTPTILRTPASYPRIQLKTPGQDGGIGKCTSPPCTTTEKITIRPQNKYHTELSEHQAVWKSDNEGFKKTHSSRQVGRAETWCGTERWQNGWSHIHVWWIKIGRDTLGMRDPRPRPDDSAQGSSTRKINPHNFWL